VISFPKAAHEVFHRVKDAIGAVGQIASENAYRLAAADLLAAVALGNPGCATNSQGAPCTPSADQIGQGFARALTFNGTALDQQKADIANDCYLFGATPSPAAMRAYESEQRMNNPAVYRAWQACITANQGNMAACEHAGLGS
jgi:hypothetical protein